MNLVMSHHSWMSLVGAILFGVFGTISLKLSHGLKKLLPTICLSISYVICFVFMTIAMQYFELSVIYAIWSGVGTLLVATIGILFFHESISWEKMFFLTLIIIGVIGIHLGDIHF